MAKQIRKSISKKLRFEVFKRDSFTCQYCGSKAPEVVLEIDHLNPVSKGGKNDILNLVTSCFECNRGKTNNKLTEHSVLEKQLDQLEILNAKKEQLKLMVKWKESLLDIESDTLSELSNHWLNLTGYTWNENGEKTVKRWIKKYPFDEIIESMNISYDKYIEFKNGECTDKSWNFAFDKIGGILFYRNLPEEEKHLQKIKMYCKSVFDDYNAYEATVLIKQYRSAGKPLEALENYCRYSANSWNEVVCSIEEVLNV